MDAFIPSAEQVRAQLAQLGHAQMQELSSVSEVPFTTLWKVRSGDTTNPGIQTVRKFWPHVAELLDRAREAAEHPAPAAEPTPAAEPARAGAAL